MRVATFRKFCYVAALVVLALGCNSPSATLLDLQLLPFGDNVAGKILFVRSGNIWAWADGRARQLTTGGTWRQPQWSPDGSEIAYVYRGTNFSEIFIMNADGSNNRRLTRSQSSSLTDNDWVFRPTWSPNGNQIAFVTDSSSYNPTVWVMNKDGSGRKQVVAASAMQEAADALSWSPDGGYLAITAFAHDVSQVLLLELARGVSQKATDSPKGAFDPAWSPDARTLAYVVRESGRTDIRVRRFDGSPEVDASQGGYARAPAWSPDGHRLAYLSARGGSFEVHVADVVAEGARLVVRNERQLTTDLNVDATSGLSWGRS